MKGINAFVLAAGLGERLLPITRHIPKPLLPILGRPIIELVISRLSLLNVEQYGINTHYKKDLLNVFASSSTAGKKVLLFPEETLLGTGGALKNAASLLSKGIFIAHNADILSNIDLEALVEHHHSSANIVTLAVHDHQSHNNVWVDRDGYLLGIGSRSPAAAGNARCVAFTGIAVYSPAFLGFLPEGYSHVTDTWLVAATRTHAIGSVDFTGCGWTDIGTPAAYAAAVFGALQEEGESVFVHPEAACGEALLGADSVLEKGVSISGAPALRSCILMPGARISGSSPIENQIIGPGYTIPLEERSASAAVPEGLLTGFLEGEETYRISPIGMGGSDRRYHRITAAGRSAVLMESPARDPDFHRQIALTLFFRRHGMPVPELIASDKEAADMPDPSVKRCYALMEDLGDTSLYSWLKCGREPSRIESVYRRVLDAVVLLHGRITAHAADCPELASRSFDYDHLRWETSYFMERFVGGLRGMVPALPEGLAGEFHRLAMLVSVFPRTMVHRDLQAQNIMITPGDTPRVIDYQGARMGPPAYDIASLLWDPYVELAPDMRERLVSYYTDTMKVRSATFDHEVFMKSLLPCRLQRHMQALGAYGFLSLVKGKSSFLKFVPRCLGYLSQEAAGSRHEYPLLYDLVRTANETA